MKQIFPNIFGFHTYKYNYYFLFHSLENFALIEFVNFKLNSKMFRQKEFLRIIFERDNSEQITFYKVKGINFRLYFEPFAIENRSMEGFSTLTPA